MRIRTIMTDPLLKEDCSVQKSVYMRVHSIMNSTWVWAISFLEHNFCLFWCLLAKCRISSTNDTEKLKFCSQSFWNNSKNNYSEYLRTKEIWIIEFKNLSQIFVEIVFFCWEASISSKETDINTNASKDHVNHLPIYLQWWSNKKTLKTRQNDKKTNILTCVHRKPSKSKDISQRNRSLTTCSWTTKTERWRRKRNGRNIVSSYL